MEEEEQIRKMLRDFGLALSESLSASSEMNRLVRRILDEGYSLHVVLDGEEDQHVATVELNTSVSTPTMKNPPFRLDSSDVAFLKSVGIDATRAVRRRR